MNLQELSDRVKEVVEKVKEDGHKPEEILVSLQMDKEEGVSIWTNKHVEVCYDDFGYVSGCVIGGYIESGE